MDISTLIGVRSIATRIITPATMSHDPLKYTPEPPSKVYRVGARAAPGSTAPSVVRPGVSKRIRVSVLYGVGFGV